MNPGFEETFRRHLPAVVGLGTRVLGDRAEAEDVAQEAFLKLAGDPVLGEGDRAVGAWLRRVTLNTAFNRLRGRRRAAARVDLVGRREEARADQAGPAVAAVLAQETRDEVRQALLALPPRQRDCLLLRHSGYAYAEIADTLGVATGSVGVLLARAERAFRSSYRPEMP